MTTAVTLALALLFALAFTACWPLLAHLDNELEEPPVSLRDHLRRYLGTDNLPKEHTMSEITDALNRLAQQVNGVSAAQATSFHNLQVAIDELRAGKLTAEQAEIVDRIEKSLTKLGEDAQAGDDGFEPVEQPTEVPGDQTPTVPGTEEPPTDGTTPVEAGTDVPADQPVESEPTDGGSTSRRR